MTEALKNRPTSELFEETGKKILDFTVSIAQASPHLSLYAGLLQNNNFNFHYLYEKSLLGLSFLRRTNIISYHLEKLIKQRLSIFSKDTFSHAYFCHGDLSNKNIKLVDDTFIFIDWEDAMLGSRIYDFCYWMTFMDQRNHLGSSFFKTFCKDEPDTLFNMLVITVLKGYLSVLDGSFQTNKLPISQRLEELLDLSDFTGI